MSFKDMRKPGEAYCSDCPDHEACHMGYPCALVKEVDMAKERNMVQSDDGNWTEAQPLPFIGWKADLEQLFYLWGFPRLARFMGRWDERKLGR